MLTFSCSYLQTTKKTVLNSYSFKDERNVTEDFFKKVPKSYHESNLPCAMKQLCISYNQFQEMNSTDALKQSKQWWSLFPSDKVTLQLI